jgi:hypothetical protein
VRRAIALASSGRSPAIANAWYVAARNGFLGSHATRVDLDADNICFVGTDHADVTPVVASMDFYDDISAGTVHGLSANLASKTIGTVAAGVFDAADLSPAWTSMAGDQFESLTMLKTTGTPATSDLIAYWDTGVTGLPFTPSGGNVNLVFAAGGIIAI